MYATKDDLLLYISPGELLQLTDDQGTDDYTSETVQAVLDEALDQASREIDAYVGLIKPVPLDPVPGLIANIAAKLAICNLFRRRTLLDEVWQDELKRCLRTLEKIGEGKLALGAGGEGQSAEPASSARLVTSTKQFGSLNWLL